MTDTNVVTPLRAKGGVKDPTAAERKRRSRANKRKRPVTAVTAAPVTPATVTCPDITPVTPPRHGGRGVTFATMVAALALAGVSAGFSIIGMTAVFVGATIPVIAMGVALELGKLSAVAWLGHNRGSASPRLRTALSILVAVLMGLNAIGAYGFLAKAHIGHSVDRDVQISGRAAEIVARISVQTGIVTDLDRRIAQIDKAVDTATQRGRTAGAMQLAAEERRARAELAVERIKEGQMLADLQVEKAGIDGERRKVKADLGPVRYLATLLGAGDQDVLRYFILAVALLLDLAAAVLLLAATSARRSA